MFGILSTVIVSVCGTLKADILIIRHSKHELPVFECFEKNLLFLASLFFMQKAIEHRGNIAEMFLQLFRTDFCPQQFDVSNSSLSRKEGIFDQFRIAPRQIVDADLPVFTHCGGFDARFHMAFLIERYSKTFAFSRLITQRIDDFLYLLVTGLKPKIEMGLNVHIIGETTFRWSPLPS